MNFRDVLTSVLVVANYPEEKRSRFINTFYEYLLIKLFEKIHESDPEAYHQLTETFGEEKATEQINRDLQEAYKKPELKKKMDEVIEEVIGELVEDIAHSATDSQRQQILSSLPR